MKKEIADKWVAALRSGQYKQGREYLRRGDQYCCLGVLCEVVEVEATETYPHFSYDGLMTFLPEVAQKRSGMKSRDGSLAGATECLAQLNDSGSTFNEIADLIEKRWEEL